MNKLRKFVKNTKKRRAQLLKQLHKLCHEAGKKFCSGLKEAGLDGTHHHLLGNCSFLWELPAHVFKRNYDDEATAHIGIFGYMSLSSGIYESGPITNTTQWLFRNTNDKGEVCGGPYGRIKVIVDSCLFWPWSDKSFPFELFERVFGDTAIKSLQSLVSKLKCFLKQLDTHLEKAVRIILRTE